MFFKLENFRVNALKMPFSYEYVDENLHDVIAGFFHIPVTAVKTDYHIIAKSIDSRRGDPELIYTLCGEIDDAFAGSVKNCEILTNEEFQNNVCRKVESYPDRSNFLLNPVVVGTGPAGLFAALALAEAGTAPLILDRGFGIDPLAQKLVNIKACTSFRAGYQPVSAEICNTSTPGAAGTVLQDLPFEKLPDKMYPFTEITENMISEAKCYR